MRLRTAIRRSSSLVHSTLKKQSCQINLSFHHIAEMIAKERGGDPDDMMLNAFWTASWLRVEDTYIKHKYSLMGPHATRYLKGQIQSIMRSPSAMDTWKDHKDRSDEGFVEFVDAMMAEAAAS
jgi:hypothetical protein